MLSIFKFILHYIINSHYIVTSQGFNLQHKLIGWILSFWLSHRPSSAHLLFYRFSLRSLVTEMVFQMVVVWVPSRKMGTWTRIQFLWLRNLLGQAYLLQRACQLIIMLHKAVVQSFHKVDIWLPQTMIWIIYMEQTTLIQELPLWVSQGCWTLEIPVSWTVQFNALSIHQNLQDISMKIIGKK